MFYKRNDRFLHALLINVSLLTSCVVESAKDATVDGSTPRKDCVPRLLDEACANQPECSEVSDGCDVVRCQCHDASEVCSAKGACVAAAACLPANKVQACSGRQCGNVTLGCGMADATCGDHNGGCANGQSCLDGQCVAHGVSSNGCPASASCRGKACGEQDSCRMATCSGPCPIGFSCSVTNQCVHNTCVPQCARKCGGPDGCGRQCPNTCRTNENCQTNYSYCANLCLGKFCGHYKNDRGQAFTCGVFSGGCLSGEQCDNSTGQCR